MIIIGVNMFYFLVSSINTNISNREMLNKETQRKLFLLYGHMKKFKIPFEIVKRAQKAILSGKRRLTDVNKFPAKFKKSIRVELEYFRYLPLLKEFQIFKFLRKDILATLGKHLTEISFPPSTPRVTRQGDLPQRRPVGVFQHGAGGRRRNVLRRARRHPQRHILDRVLFRRNRAAHEH